jgi:hypothetical protein
VKFFKKFKLGIWKTFGSWQGNHLLTCCGFGEQRAKHLLFSICNDPSISLDLILDSKVNGYIENFECFYFSSILVMKVGNNH